MNWDVSTKTEIEKIRTKLDRVRSIDIEEQRTLHNKLVTIEDEMKETARKLAETNKVINSIVVDIKHTAKQELISLITSSASTILVDGERSKHLNERKRT